jgi:putative oxidoreductase
MEDAMQVKEAPVLLARYSDQLYALMRIVTGFLFACHGAQKLFGVLGASSELHDPEGLAAGVIEFCGGVLVCVGLFTRLAAFIASGEMAVAYFKAHAPRGFWPVVNRGELAALYAFVFLYISARGSGVWGVDALRARHTRRRV